MTVVEIARPMGRAVSPILSDFYLKAHGAFGVKFRIGRGVKEIRGRGKAEAVVLTDGEVLPADLVIVGIGRCRRRINWRGIVGSSARTGSLSTRI